MADQKIFNSLDTALDGRSAETLLPTAAPAGGGTPLAQYTIVPRKKAAAPSAAAAAAVNPAQNGTPVPAPAAAPGIQPGTIQTGPVQTIAVPQQNPLEEAQRALDTAKKEYAKRLELSEKNLKLGEIRVHSTEKQIATDTEEAKHSWWHGTTKQIEKGIESEKKLLKEQQTQFARVKEDHQNALNIQNQVAAAEVKAVKLLAEGKAAEAQAVIAASVQSLKAVTPLVGRAKVGVTNDEHRATLAAISQDLENQVRYIGYTETAVRTVRNTAIATGVVIGTAGVGTGALAIGGGITATGWTAAVGFTTLGTTAAAGLGNLTEAAGHTALGNKDAGQAFKDAGSQTLHDAKDNLINSIATAVGFRFAGPITGTIARGLATAGTRSLTSTVAHGLIDPAIAEKFDWPEIEQRLDSRISPMEMERIHEQWRQQRGLTVQQLVRNGLIDLGVSAVLGGAGAQTTALSQQITSTAGRLATVSAVDSTLSTAVGTGAGMLKATLDGREFTGDDLIREVTGSVASSVAGNLSQAFQRPPTQPAKTPDAPAPKPDADGTDAKPAAANADNQPAAETKNPAGQSTGSSNQNPAAPAAGEPATTAGQPAAGAEQTPASGAKTEPAGPTAMDYLNASPLQALRMYRQKHNPQPAAADASTSGTPLKADDSSGGEAGGKTAAAKPAAAGTEPSNEPLTKPGQPAKPAAAETEGAKGKTEAENPAKPDADGSPPKLAEDAAAAEPVKLTLRQRLMSPITKPINRLRTRIADAIAPAAAAAGSEPAAAAAKPAESPAPAKTAAETETPAQPAHELAAITGPLKTWLGRVGTNLRIRTANSIDPVGERPLVGPGGTELEPGTIGGLFDPLKKLAAAPIRYAIPTRGWLAEKLSSDGLSTQKVGIPKGVDPAEVKWVGYRWHGFIDAIDNAASHVPLLKYPVKFITAVPRAFIPIDQKRIPLKAFPNGVMPPMKHALQKENWDEMYRSPVDTGVSKQAATASSGSGQVKNPAPSAPASPAPAALAPPVVPTANKAPVAAAPAAGTAPKAAAPQPDADPALPPPVVSPAPAAAGPLPKVVDTAADSFGSGLINRLVSRKGVVFAGDVRLEKVKTPDVLPDAQFVEISYGSPNMPTRHMTLQIDSKTLHAEPGLLKRVLGFAKKTPDSFVSDQIEALRSEHPDLQVRQRFITGQTLIDSRAKPRNAAFKDELADSTGGRVEFSSDARTLDPAARYTVISIADKKARGKNQEKVFAHSKEGGAAPNLGKEVVELARRFPELEITVGEAAGSALLQKSSQPGKLAQNNPAARDKKLGNLPPPTGSTS